jgi:hypothetical protein
MALKLTKIVAGGALVFREHAVFDEIDCRDDALDIFVHTASAYHWRSRNDNEPRRTGVRMRNGKTCAFFGNNFPMEPEFESRRVMRVGRQRQVGIED